jgi:hypothetical protein
VLQTVLHCMHIVDNLQDRLTGFNLEFAAVSLQQSPVTTQQCQDVKPRCQDTAPLCRVMLAPIVMIRYSSEVVFLVVCDRDLTC